MELVVKNRTLNRRFATSYGEMNIPDHCIPDFDRHPECAQLPTNRIILGGIACTRIARYGIAEDAFYIATEALAQKNPLLGRRLGAPHRMRIHASVQHILQWARMGRLIYDMTWTPITFICINHDMASATKQFLESDSDAVACADSICGLPMLLESVDFQIRATLRQRHWNQNRT